MRASFLIGVGIGTIILYIIAITTGWHTLIYTASGQLGGVFLAWLALRSTTGRWFA